MCVNSSFTDIYTHLRFPTCNINKSGILRTQINKLKKRKKEKKKKQDAN
jgi:hypothetical protein